VGGQKSFDSAHRDRDLNAEETMLISAPNAKARDNKNVPKIVKECEKEKGQWFHWDQDTFLGKATLGKGGVCAPLVVVWLRHVRGGKGTWGDFIATQDAREEVMSLKVAQGKTPETYAGNYLKDFNLKQVSQEKIPGREQVTKLIKSDGFYMVGITNFRGESGDDPKAVQWIKENGKAHAFGVVTGKDGYCVFDPNYGAGLFPTADQLSAFFNRLWKHIYEPMQAGDAILTRFVKA
jgi:hypothetical protein